MTRIGLRIILLFMALAFADKAFSGSSRINGNAVMQTDIVWRQAQYGSGTLLLAIAAVGIAESASHPPPSVDCAKTTARNTEAFREAVENAIVAEGYRRGFTLRSTESRDDPALGDKERDPRFMERMER